MVPFVIIGLDDDGMSSGQLLLGELGGSLAPLLDLTGGLGGVNRQVASLHLAGSIKGLGNHKVAGVAVDVAVLTPLHFLLQGRAIHVQLDLSNIVHMNMGGCRSCRLLLRAGGEHRHRHAQQNKHGN